MWFKLLNGLHDQGDGKVYRRGDVVNSKQDLEKRFGPAKFQRVADPAQVKEEEPVASAPVSVQDEFSDMTVAELKQFAASEEIDLGSASRKDEILAVIREVVARM